MRMNNQLLETARLWAAHDPDPSTKGFIDKLIAEGNEEELSKAFAGALTFGTAGIRGEVGAGESRMNRAVVIRTTAGVMNWLNKQCENPVVVIGCDARHGSEQFHKDAAAVVSAAGGKALILPQQNPTPLTAFSVKKLGADAGIMITASHNPPADNGYKVYLGGRVATGAAEGVQLISPADKEIAAAIAEAGFADEIPMSTENIEEIDTRADYLARANQLAGKYRDVTIALTAMHGVGAALGEKLLKEAGFNVSLVPEQAEPDPDFPTVNFPNPEEKGALDLAKAHATKIGAEVIIAYDPDADRCAVAVPDAQAEGGFRQLTGDELGALLGNYMIDHVAADRHSFANSIVSGRLLSKVAANAGFNHDATLTGFKWIARTPHLGFGYEEAIGYCCDPEAVADKDGISTSIVVASMVGELKSQGKTLDDALDDLARTHGLYATAPLTFRVEDLSIISTSMATLRNQPPTQLAGAKIIEVKDMAKDELGIGATDGMYFITESGDRVICRPSGTEPKLKFYLEVVLPVEGDNVPRAEATERLDRIAQDLREHLGL
ncbi:phosphomannomutase [Corynebacterium kutscheri]|uniref:Phosphomannomutase n=2 Tax=Corynebacterium kutscheri TaxID=35755 RepID=A0A0F6QZD3_9CORY|nr:phosphomannomutase [Corynebacterium kutscheri]VEH09391.1 phosphomannomutase [Corynebacterium kutscheri]